MATRQRLCGCIITDVQQRNLRFRLLARRRRLQRVVFSICVDSKFSTLTRYLCIVRSLSDQPVYQVVDVAQGVSH